MDTSLRFSTNRSRVIDLGGLESINLGWRNYVRAPVECTAALANQVDFDGNGFIGKGCTPGEMVYFPLPAFCHDRVQNPDEVGAPVYVEQCLGPTTPTRTYGIGTSATFFQRLTVDILGEGVNGQWLSSGTAYQNARRRVWPLCRETVAAIADGRQRSAHRGREGALRPVGGALRDVDAAVGLFQGAVGVRELPGAG